MSESTKKFIKSFALNCFTKVAVHPPKEEEPKPYVETYKDKRLKEYGSAQEQIEFITEKGLDAWKTNVDEIKKKYPKE